MRFNWVDITILSLLFLSFISGLRRSVVKGVINLFLAVCLISFILICLDSIVLPDFLAVPLKKSLFAKEFLRIFAFVRTVNTQ